MAIKSNPIWFESMTDEITFGKYAGWTIGKLINSYGFIGAYDSAFNYIKWLSDNKIAFCSSEVKEQINKNIIDYISSTIKHFNPTDAIGLIKELKLLA